MKNKAQVELELPPGLVKIIIIGVLVLIGLILLASSVYTIPAGHRGIVLTFGKPDPVASTEGLHFKIPIAQTVKKMEVRTQKMESTADSASKDLQDIQTTIALNYRVIPEETVSLYQNIGLSYRERIIQPTIEESVKASTAMFTAEELITRRPEVKAGIKKALTERLLDSHIVVTDLNIVNFQFSEQFDKAIESKQVAEQEALKAERVLERVKIEAEQKVTQAQAEAEAIRLQAEQIKESQEILQLRAIEKWDGVLPTITGTGVVPFIDLQTMSGVN